MIKYAYVFLFLVCSSAMVTHAETPWQNAMDSFYSVITKVDNNDPRFIALAAIGTGATLMGCSVIKNNLTPDVRRKPSWSRAFAGAGLVIAGIGLIFSAKTLIIRSDAWPLDRLMSSLKLLLRPDA
jgi:sulfite exporter TauE/SafE